LNNKLKNHDRIANVIENAVMKGSGYAASEAASTIDKEFVLIAKADLPPVIETVNALTDRPRVGARTAGYFRATPSSKFWERAHDIIAVALHAEKEQDKEMQAKRELISQRELAYSMLYPQAPTLWDYEAADIQVKTKIDVVVNLMRQVDELKASK
jgi:hypothetical protein